MANRSDDLIEIGKRLAQLRTAMGFGKHGGQAQFAHFLEFSPSQLNNWESGLKRPEINNAIRICERTGATLDWIYRGNRGALPVDLARKLPDHSQPGSETA